MTKRVWALAVMALGLELVGCGPRWTVIQQAEPNPFIGEKNFIIMPVDFTGLMVGKKTEEEYLSEKKDKTVESFLQDKEDMAANIESNIIADSRREGIKIKDADGAPDTYVIKPHVGHMEPGFFAVIVSNPSEVILNLKIEDKDGKLLDEVEIVSRTPANNWASVAAGSRYRQDGENLGHIAADYIISRVYGD